MHEHASKGLVRWAIAASRGREQGLFVIEGKKAIHDCLDARVVLSHVLVAAPLDVGSDLAPLSKRLADLGVPVSLVSAEALRRMAHTRTPQGVLAIAERPAVTTTDLERTPLLAVYLDRVQDPGNVGAVVRCSLALGATHVVRGPETADPFSPKAMRAGAAAQMRIPIVEDPGDVLERLARTQATLLALDPHATLPIHDLPAAGPRSILILGNEGQGLSERCLRLATRACRIPLHAASESLNVAQAAAIALYVWQARARNVSHQ